MNSVLNVRASPTPTGSRKPAPSGLVRASQRPSIALNTNRVSRMMTVRSAESDSSASEPVPEPVEAPREDDVLPDSLEDSLRQAAASTAQAIRAGRTRCIVEILLPEFWDPSSGALFKEEGDQQRWWRLTKKFIEFLGEECPGETVKAVYPDIGVAAMLKDLWKDQGLTFGISSLLDRRPLTEDDSLIVIAAPDPQGADETIRVSNSVGEEKAVVLFNPRLASGDVGVGLNVRRLRENFLKNFVTTYSLRPIGDVGSVFRRYPGLWQVFIQDPNEAGRYKLIAEEPMRPAGEKLDMIVMEAMNPGSTGQGAEGEKGSGPGLFQQLANTMNSLNRFMKQLSN